MRVFARFLEDNLLGVRFAINVFIGTSLVWVILKSVSDTNPIWAIASLVVASDPQVSQAMRTIRGRIINAMIGCAVGLFVILIGGSSAWMLPFALAIAVLISTYMVRIQAMWRQAPITAAIVVASNLAHHSKLTGAEDGLHKVAEVIFGCLMGLLVTLIMGRLWPIKTAPQAASLPKGSA
jgi:uncharacterized membrane protein YccC